MALIARSRRRSRKYDVIAKMIEGAGTGIAGIITAKKKREAEAQKQKVESFEDEREAREKLRKDLFQPAEKVVTKGKAEYGTIRPPKFPKLTEAMLKRMLPEEEKPPTAAEMRARERHEAWRTKQGEPDAPPKLDAAAQDLEVYLRNPDWLVPVVREGNVYAGMPNQIEQIRAGMREQGITDPEIQEGILDYILDPDTYSKLGGKGSPPVRMKGSGNVDPLEALDSWLIEAQKELAAPE